MSKEKTSEEIIDKVFPVRELVPYWDEFFTDVKECMEQYAEQKLKEREERENHLIDAFIELCNESYQQGWCYYSMETPQDEEEYFKQMENTRENTMPMIELKIKMRKLNHRK